MKKLIFSLLGCLMCMPMVSSQTISDLINEVNLDSMQLTLREFSGEQPTTVNGTTVTILNRQQANNDLAADYLIEKFQDMANINVTAQPFNANGINVIATQLGQTSPNDIYVICAHYDTVADYCADDNASGVAAVLEIARILSSQCLDNTIVYALWDEEEIGLNGSNFYANQAVANGDNILGVLNIDMMGYDGNDDNDFDIDVRNFANSIAMKDDILAVLNNPAYGFTLNVNVVNPGTTLSDHSSFWFAGSVPSDAISAVLVGESWETNDETPFYHSSGDRYSTLNFPYYHELAQLIMGYMATKGGLVGVDNTISQSVNMLTSNDGAASYQWIDCTTDTAIPGATSQSFVPTVNGTYAVEVTSGSCTERSACIVFDTLGLIPFSEEDISVFPNPVKTNLTIELNSGTEDLDIKLYALSGKLVRQTTSDKTLTTLDINDLAQGVYFLKLKRGKKSGTFKVVKE